MSRILLIDDDDMLRKVLRVTLTKMGHTVTEARNGMEASRFLARESVDLVITDLIMPERDGLEMITEVKRKYPALKVIAMSGGDRLSHMDFLPAARLLGAARILSKPFSEQELAAAIRELDTPP